MNYGKPVMTKSALPKTPGRANAVNQEKQRQAALSDSLAKQMNGCFPNMQPPVNVNLAHIDSNQLFDYISQMLFHIKLNENFVQPAQFDAIESCTYVYRQLTQLATKYETSNANIVPHIWVLLHYPNTSFQEVSKLLDWLCSVKKVTDDYRDKVHRWFLYNRPALAHLDDLKAKKRRQQQRIKEKEDMVRALVSELQKDKAQTSQRTEKIKQLDYEIGNLKAILPVVINHYLDLDQATISN